MDVSIIKERFAHYDAMARKLYPAYARMPVPRLIFHSKGNVNGRAYSYGHSKHSWTVSLNNLVAIQVGEEFNNTISHEIAHMVDFATRGKSNHDRVWKAIHSALGGSAQRCSSYGSTVKRIAGRVTNWYVYRTATGAELVLGARHHNGLRNGKYNYVSSARGERVVAANWTGEIRKKGLTA